MLIPTNEEIQEASRVIKSNSESGMRHETITGDLSKLPSIQSISMMTCMLQLAADPLDTVGVALAMMVLIGIQIGEKRAMEMSMAKMGGEEG